MNEPITIEQVLELTKHLPLVDKVRLIERITPQINRDLKVIRKQSRKSLRGISRGVNITSEDIDDARRELWSSSISLPANTKSPRGGNCNCSSESL